MKNVFHCLFGPWQQKINEGYSNLALKGVKYMKSFVTSEESFKGFKDKYVFLRPTKNVWNDLFEVEPSGENKYRSWFPLYWSYTHYIEKAKAYVVKEEDLNPEEKDAKKGLNICLTKSGFISLVKWCLILLLWIGIMF